MVGKPHAVPAVGTTKTARGEFLEAVAALDFRRLLALGPLALQSRGGRPTGVRRLEHVAPDLAVEIARTVTPCDPAACFAALERTIDLYRRLRENLAKPELRRSTAAERVVCDYVHVLAARTSRSRAARLFPVPDLR